MRKTGLVAGCVLGVLGFAASQAHAGAFYIQEQSIKGMGRAYSGEAADQGAEDLWWNPAAIAGMTDKEIYNGITGPRRHRQCERHRHHAPAAADPNHPACGPVGERADRRAFGPAAPDSGGLAGHYRVPSIPGVALPNALGLTPAAPVGGPNAKNPIPRALVPSFGAAIPLTDKLTLGISTAAPFNAITSYKGDSFVRYDAQKSRFLNINLQATAAYQLFPWLNLGAGADVDYFDATLTQQAPDLVAPFPDGKIEVQGEDVAFGWVAGAQIKPIPTVNIGISYRASIKHKLDGDIYITGFQGPFALVTGQQSATTSLHPAGHRHRRRALEHHPPPDPECSGATLRLVEVQ